MACKFHPVSRVHKTYFNAASKNIYKGFPLKVFREGLVGDFVKLPGLYFSTVSILLLFDLASSVIARDADLSDEHQKK